ncbi:MAG: hypothetical protein WA705_31175 [Candidatus Ozemobacteraceae bacterium]
MRFRRWLRNTGFSLLSVALACGAFAPVRAFALGAAVAPVKAFQLAFRLKVGAVYTFDVKSRTESSITVGELDEHTPAEAVDSVSVRVLAFRGGIYVLDIFAGARHVRRLMREDGTLLLTPGERSLDLPLFLSFPPGDWPFGKVHRVESSFDVGGKMVPGHFEMVPSGRDSAKGTVGIKFAGIVELPTDRAIQRKLTVKGSLTYDEKIGCFSAGEWGAEYALDYANKEIAVIRPILNVKEIRTISFRLKGVTP